MMRALVFEGPADDTSRTRVAQLPVPECGPDQVLVEVVWAGVNFKDVMVRRGDPGYAPYWPVVPGLEASGRVRAIVPDDVSLAAACAVPGALTTAELLLHDVARIRADDVIVVHSAAGAVGSAIA